MLHNIHQLATLQVLLHWQGRDAAAQYWVCRTHFIAAREDTFLPLFTLPHALASALPIHDVHAHCLSFYYAIFCALREPSGLPVLHERECCTASAYTTTSPARRSSVGGVPHVDARRDTAAGALACAVRDTVTFTRSGSMQASWLENIIIQIPRQEKRSCPLSYCLRFRLWQ